MNISKILFRYRPSHLQFHLHHLNVNINNSLKCWCDDGKLLQNDGGTGIVANLKCLSINKWKNVAQISSNILFQICSYCRCINQFKAAAKKSVFSLSAH